MEGGSDVPVSGGGKVVVKVEIVDGQCAADVEEKVEMEKMTLAIMEGNAVIKDKVVDKEGEEVEGRKVVWRNVRGKCAADVWGEVKMKGYEPTVMEGQAGIEDKVVDGEGEVVVGRKVAWDIAEIPEECGITNKKVRKRKKALYKAIRRQVEFYFSDANLSKDRFMQKSLSENEQVEVEVFTKFNKISALCDDVKEIARALSFSTVLKLSEDGTKVSRISPYHPRSPEEVDRCTIYVEELPVSATIEWIQSIFKEFGSIEYVSLPKYRESTRIKGFAFVEFSAADSAEKAVQAFAETSCLSELDPGKLCSVTAFNIENSGVQVDNVVDTPIIKEKDATEAEPAKNAGVKVDNVVDTSIKKEKDTTEAEPTKNTRVEVVMMAVDAIKKEKDALEEEPAKKKRRLDGEGNDTAEGTEHDSKDESQDSKKAEAQDGQDKKVKKKRRRKNVVPTNPIGREAGKLNLRVMSKKDWKKLRNQYLNMQRKCHREQVLSKMLRGHDNKRHRPAPAPAPVEMEIPVEDVREPEAAPALQTGLIVKITLDEPISDSKRFKNQVKSRDEVCYVEAEECRTVAFARCKDPEAAKSLISQNIWTAAEILEGDEERDYLRKIENGRIKKRESRSGKGKKGNNVVQQSLNVKCEQHCQDVKPKGGQHIRFEPDA